jgi:hypothetical protein
MAKGVHHLCKAQHTSGMEKSHEEATLATTNFLGHLDVPVYEGGWNANSLEGMNLPKGEVMKIPDRLKIFMQMILSERSDAAGTRVRLDDAEEMLRNVRRSLAEKQDVLHRIATLDESAAMVIFFDLRKAAAEEAAKLEKEQEEYERNNPQGV